MNALVQITEHDLVDAPLEVAETITIRTGEIEWGSEAAAELLASVRAFCGLLPVTPEIDFAEACFLARCEARAMLHALGELTADEAGVIFSDYPMADESAEEPMDDYDGLPATFAAACRKADARQRRVSADPAIERARRLLDDNISLDRAWAEINDPRNRPQRQRSPPNPNPLKMRLREFWSAASAARNAGDHAELRQQFTAHARKSGLVAALGRHGEQDVQHVLDWALRGMNPWGRGEFPDD